MLDRHTCRGELWREEHGKVRCLACGHRCLLKTGARGVCKVRFHQGGELRVPFGYVAGLACDPIEKKPFFHLLPGCAALTFGMMGCDFQCSFCQNWVTSQALRDPAAKAPIRPVSAVQITRAALEEGAAVVVSSYNEPLITAEWAAAVFREARAQGLLCAFVSNGHGTPEALDYLSPWLTGLKIDLKGFDERRYRTLGGSLARVTETIRGAVARGFWVEVVTLIIPGFNDDPVELRELAGFLVGVNPDIPWHVTAFHPDYEMNTHRACRVEDLLRAAEIGRQAGLRYVYAGNLPGRVGNLEDTRCPTCGEVLIRRRGFTVLENRLGPAGSCPDCGQRVPGVWNLERAGRGRVGERDIFRNQS